jgi:hypothetical protein
VYLKRLVKTSQISTKDKMSESGEIIPLAQRIQQDAPNDACNYLLVEEHKCIENALKCEVLCKY